MSEVNQEVEVSQTITHEEMAKDFYEPESKESNEESSASSLATGAIESNESTETDGEDSTESEVADAKEKSEDQEYSLELGEESLLDEGFLEEVESFAKEKGLSKEVAQEWVAKQEAFIKEQVDLAQEKQDEEIEAWKQSVIDDPKMGGDNLKQTVSNARKVVERFGGEELSQILNDTGFGNHPVIVGFLAQIGSLMNEDSLILPGEGMAKEQSLEDLFYGTKN